MRFGESRRQPESKTTATETMQINARIRRWPQRKGQRREPAADDAGFVSERNGWLPFAAPLGSAILGGRRRRAGRTPTAAKRAVETKSTMPDNNHGIPTTGSRGTSGSPRSARHIKVCIRVNSMFGVLIVQIYRPAHDVSCRKQAPTSSNARRQQRRSGLQAARNRMQR